MNAMLPLNNKTKRKVRQEVAKEYERQGQESVRRIYKLMCAVYNELYGHGKIRCGRAIARIGELSNKHKDDEVFWAHIDRVVIDQMGIEFERENYELMDR
jgi:hypothetical protein